MAEDTTTNGTTSPAITGTYAASYATLAAMAERLRVGGDAVGIDTLVEVVRAARAAHRVCQARLDAVRRELDAEVAEAEAGIAENEQNRRA